MKPKFPRTNKRQGRRDERRISRMMNKIEKKGSQERKSDLGPGDILPKGGPHGLDNELKGAELNPYIQPSTNDRSPNKTYTKGKKTMSFNEHGGELTVSKKGKNKTKTKIYDLEDRVLMTKTKKKR